MFKLLWQGLHAYDPTEYNVCISRSCISFKRKFNLRYIIDYGFLIVRDVEWHLVVYEIANTKSWHKIYTQRY